MNNVVEGWKRLFFLAVVITCALSLGACLFAPMEGALALEDSSAYEDEFSDKTLSQYAHLSDPASSVSLSVQSSNKSVRRWPNGDSYKGQMSKNKMNGTGVYTYANGATLNGAFKNNKFLKGTYKAKSGKNSYQLKIKSGKPYSATISTAKGFTYKGDFSNGKLNGKGVATYKKGGKYSGKFAAGKRSGKGTYSWISGAKYDGSWKKDVMSGKGTYYYPKNAKVEKIVGTFANNKPDGACTCYARSGETYTSVWSKGKLVKVS